MMAAAHTMTMSTVREREVPRKAELAVCITGDRGACSEGTGETAASKAELAVCISADAAGASGVWIEGAAAAVTAVAALCALKHRAGLLHAAASGCMLRRLRSDSVLCRAGDRELLPSPAAPSRA